MAAKFKEAGITPLSCGNVWMKNDAADIRRAFEYARDIGLPTIVCSPEPASMKILDAVVKEFDIKLAIHNHGPEDKKFPSPYDVWKAVAALRQAHRPLHRRRPHRAREGGSRGGHPQVPGAPLRLPPQGHRQHGAGRQHRSRAAAACSTSSRSCARCSTCNYPHLASFEYEKDENDPVPGLSETIGYSKGLLAGMA